MEKTKTSAVYGNGQNKPLPKVIKAGKFAALQASAHWLRQGGVQLNPIVLQAGFHLKRNIETAGFHAKKQGQIVLQPAVCCKNHSDADFAAVTKAITGGKSAYAEDATKLYQPNTFYQASKFYQASAQHKKTQASSQCLKFAEPMRWQGAFFLLIANAAKMFPRASIKPRCLLAQFFSALKKTSAADFSSRLSFERDGVVAAQFNGNEPSLFLHSSLFLLRFDIIGFKPGKEFFRLFDCNHAFGKKGQNVFACKIVIFRCGNDGKQAKRHFFLCDGSTHSKGSHGIDWRHGLSFFIKTILPTIVKLPAVLIKKVGNRLVLKEKYFTPKGCGFQLYTLFFLSPPTIAAWQKTGGLKMDASTLRRLALLNLSTEQMSAVLELLADIDERDGARKAKTRERVRRCRERKKTAETLLPRECNSTETLPLSPKRKVPPHPLKENNPYPAFSLTGAAMAETERYEPNGRSAEILDEHVSAPSRKRNESGGGGKTRIGKRISRGFLAGFSQQMRQAESTRCIFASARP